MRPPCKRTAIVGGGLSGMLAIKMLKDEGIEPVCFEKADDIGGAWRYLDDAVEGISSTMWSTVLNHSKEFFISDYIPPAEVPNYLRHFEFYEYIKGFINSHGLHQYYYCNREVILVRKAHDYNETGRWEVSIKNTIDESVATEIFDAVLVCAGQFAHPKIPQYHGMNEFTGQILHTHSLKKVDKFYGKNVAVIGTSCSSLDAATEISTVSKQVYLSSKTPSWIIPRVGPNGLPFDYTLVRRYIIFMLKFFPKKWLSWLVETYFVNTKFNFKLYGIEPKYPLLARVPIINDDIPSRLISGAVVLRKDVKRFTENGVIFDGEKQETKIDCAIMGTGYEWKFDFLEEDIIQHKNGKFNLYKCVYPIYLRHPTLAFISFAMPYGSGFPLAELQLRWAAHLLANANECLPEEKYMLRDITKKYEVNLKERWPNDKMSLNVDIIPYCDEIAEELGVLPNFWKMAFTDPKLFLACMFGPCIPSQYRLVGPGSWTGARDAILTSHIRMQTPLSPERLEQKSGTRLRVYVLTNLLIPLMLAFLLAYNESKSKFYVAAITIPYYIFNSRFISKFFLLLLLIPLFYSDWHGLVALHILVIIMFIYCNLGNVIANRHLWT